ncbi:MAG: NADH-quinone oxidoreductase subunit NuoB [Luteitalea sp.]|nr:NADH-quinone oxidoreductase subunit NuoB [Luteitalea sp.]
MLLFSKIWRTRIATEAVPPGDPAAIEIVRVLEQRIKRLLGRALAIREIDAGSCNGCELEITGLASPIYDMERFGMHFVASPRHADLLLVTGPVTRNMEVPLRRTYDATPAPKFVVAVGDCAKNCGVFGGSYAVVGPVDRVIPVDISIAGCPPEPFDILRGILQGLDRFAEKRTRVMPISEGSPR